DPGGAQRRAGRAVRARRRPGVAARAGLARRLHHRVRRAGAVGRLRRGQRAVLRHATLLSLTDRTMTEALVVSNIVLWVAVLALLGTVFALARQIGVLYERIAPMGALM